MAHNVYRAAGVLTLLLLPIAGSNAQPWPSPHPDGDYHPDSTATRTLPRAEALRGLERIRASTADRLEPILWIEPGRTNVPDSFLPPGTRNDNSSERFPLHSSSEAGLWFHGDEAGRTFGIVRERDGIEGVFHAYDLEYGMYQPLTVGPPYALAPTRPLLAAQQGMLVVSSLFGSQERGWTQLLSEWTFLVWAGDGSVIMDNGMESRTVSVDGVESPWPLPGFTASSGGRLATYPVSHDRTYPAPVALADGTILDVSHHAAGDVLWWWRPPPENADTGAEEERSQYPLHGQAVALAARNIDGIVALVITEERGSALRIFAPQSGTAEGTREKIPLDHRVWRWGSIALLSDQIVLVADDTGLVHVISLATGAVVRVFSLPEPVIQAASAGDRLVGLSLGARHPGVLLGIR